MHFFLEVEWHPARLECATGLHPIVVFLLEYQCDDVLYYHLCNVAEVLVELAEEALEMLLWNVLALMATDLLEATLEGVAWEISNYYHQMNWIPLFLRQKRNASDDMPQQF